MSSDIIINSDSEMIQFTCHCTSGPSVLGLFQPSGHCAIVPIRRSTDTYIDVLGLHDTPQLLRLLRHVQVARNWQG